MCEVEWLQCRRLPADRGTLGFVLSSLVAACTAVEPVISSRWPATPPTTLPDGVRLYVDAPDPGSSPSRRPRWPAEASQPGRPGSSPPLVHRGIRPSQARRAPQRGSALARRRVTVTDFARLRGLSTSFPLSRAA